MRDYKNQGHVMCGTMKDPSLQLKDSNIGQTVRNSDLSLWAKYFLLRFKVTDKQTRETEDLQNFYIKVRSKLRHSVK